MSYNTMIFSEKWLGYAREIGREEGMETALKYLEAVLNYGLAGSIPPYKFNEKAREAFNHSVYEIQLLNPKAEKMEGIGIYGEIGSDYIKPEAIINQDEYNGNE